jgi:hypothetical protein
MEYSYLLGLLPWLDLTFWNYSYLTIFLVILVFVVSAKISSIKSSKHTKFYYFAASSLISMGLFGIVGWVSHLGLSFISYALVSEFSGDY